MIKQIKIDNGQMGGTIQMILNSMFVFNLLTFINTSILLYQSVIYKYIPLVLYILSIICFAFVWVSIYYFIIYPSVIRFGNRQSYAHGSPIKKDFDKINKQLYEIKKCLQIKS